MQQYIKDHIITFLDTHNIINENHHGSQKYYSTSTALASINHHLINNYYNDTDQPQCSL